MNNLTTRKIVLGLLMALVLAFSVQGIADALLLTPVSDIVQSKRVGDKFEITFSVGLTGSTQALNSAGKRVSDANADAIRIDSSGYEVFDATNRQTYRYSTGATALSGTLYVDPRPTYRYVTGNTVPEATQGTVTRGRSRDSAGATSDLYVNSSGQVVDATGKLVYTRTGVGTRADTATSTVNDPYVYTLGAVQNPNDPLSESHRTEPDRFDYNEEEVKVTIGSVPADTRFTIVDKIDNAPVANNHVMNENDHFAKLRTRVTLVCTPFVVGTHTITITDETADKDFPIGRQHPTTSDVKFTLYVTPVILTGTTPTIAVKQTRVGEITDDTYPVSSLYTFTPAVDATAGADFRVRYQVTKGSGTLYEGTIAKSYTRPTQDLTVHRASEVSINMNGTTNEVVASIPGTSPIVRANPIVFEYTGTAAPTGGGQQQTGSLTITVTGTGTTRSVTVNAVSAAGTPTAIPVVLTGTATSTQSVITGTETEITLPTAPGSYTLTATASVAGYTPDTETITVAGPTSLGTISISQIGTPTNGVQTFSITVRRTDGTTPAPLTVTVSGTGFTTSSVPTANGSGAVNIALPTTAGVYTLTAMATGYTSGPTTVRIVGTGQTTVTPTPTPTPTPPPADTGGVPDSIEITGPSTRSGTVNEALDTPLLVRVLDDDGDGLEGARVFYRVSSGRGRLSARGNGRAIGVVTDDDGYARASFTPLDGGTITVRANTDDLSATVTFTITTGSASSASGARDSGTGGTPGMISPVVHVGAASRPPMLWVDGGAIYALVGASPQRFAASVDNALNITVGGGKVYWTEKTGDAGTINSANLNGSGVTELASIFATPMGIAVDVTNSKLYWTNSAGRIQSANLDGSRITNVIPGGLETPMDLALAGGNAYWTQGGNVRFVNLRGTKQIRNISTGTDTAGSLVIGGGKVYWTEMTGESGGTVNSANLNGTGATQLASIQAVPMGIAVDGSRSKLYWTNSRGRIQSANLDGSGIKNVVSGLGSPGELVLSNNIATPTAAATTTTTTTASNAKYDVNSDGSVDNTDAGLVADAMGTSNARYDVNGDGTVNFLDLLLVFDNRDPGAAGAPTIVGMKLSAAQIDIIEEQIDLLIATNDRSPAAMRVLVYLQQLLVTARPEKTQLLANYPNPFNPETWIPYELATDTDVRLTIYNTQGVVIRSLELGHQSAGYYTGRDRAAYWDGRNALGEQVASGLYFYQLETDEMSLMRKMVILK